MTNPVLTQGDFNKPSEGQKRILDAAKEVQVNEAQARAVEVQGGSKSISGPAAPSSGEKTAIVSNPKIDHRVEQGNIPSAVEADANEGQSKIIARALLDSTANGDLSKLEAVISEKI